MAMPDSFWGSAGPGGDDPAGLAACGGGPEPPRELAGPGEGSPGEPAGRQARDRAYFLDLLGDGHHGLGCHEAAIEAYREAADGFRSRDARCSHVLCLFKIAASYMSLGEPWHAHGYLEACLPLLGELGLTRHETLARRQLEECQAALTGVGLAGGPGPPPQAARPAGPPQAARPAGPPQEARPAGAPRRGRAQGQLKQSRCRRVATVDSCYARDRGTAALAQRR
jgi:hypothetical protein